MFSLKCVYGDLTEAAVNALGENPNTVDTRNSQRTERFVIDAQPGSVYRQH